MITNERYDAILSNAIDLLSQTMDEYSIKKSLNITDEEFDEIGRNSVHIIYVEKNSEDKYETVSSFHETQDNVNKYYFKNADLGILSGYSNITIDNKSQKLIGIAGKVS